MKRKIVVFSSWGPGNFQTVLNFCESHSDWEVGLLVSDCPETPSTSLAAERGVPVFFHPIPGRLIVSDTKSLRAREVSLQPIFRKLCAFEDENGNVDLIVLAFRKILVGPILSRFSQRMINVHPADLSVYSIPTKKRRYTGIDGLKRSIEDGNRTTRTSIHFVTKGVDEGPLIVLGPEIAFCGNKNSSVDIETHEAAQKLASDVPALIAALEAYVKHDEDRERWPHIL